MAFNIPNGAFRLSGQEAGGGPDYVAALQKGFQGAADVYKPKKAAEDLLAQMLQNKLNKPKAEDAQGWYDLEKQYRNAQIQQALRKPQLSGDLGMLDYLSNHPDLFNEMNNSGSDAQPDMENRPAINIPTATQDNTPPNMPPLAPDNGSNPNVSAEGPGSIDSGSPFVARGNHPRNYRQEILKHMLNKMTGTPEVALQGPARYVEDLARLKEKYGADSPEYKQAQQIAMADVSSKEALANQRTGAVPRLKPGESYLKDDAGQFVGINHPPTQKESDEIAGRTFFNETYPIVNKGASLFTGEGSIQRLENAAANYKTDPKARQVFDDFLLAEKLSATTAVKEAATVGAGKQKEVFNQFKDSLAKSDVPKVLQKLMKEYQIPASAQYKAGLRMQEVLNKASEKAASSIPATVPRYFKPQTQKNNQPIKMVWKDGNLVRAE